MSTIMPTIKSGLKMVITIKERFRTLAKYSRFTINPSLLAIVLTVYGLNKKNPDENSNNAAKKEDLLNFLVLLEEDLDEKKFFLVKERKKIMVQKIRNIFNKLELSSDDIKILIGIFKALKKTNK